MALRALEFHMRVMPKFKNYDEATKNRVAWRFLQGENWHIAARENGIPFTTVCAWVKKKTIEEAQEEAREVVFTRTRGGARHRWIYHLEIDLAYYDFDLTYHEFDLTYYQFDLAYCEFDLTYCEYDLIYYESDLTYYEFDVTCDEFEVKMGVVI